MKMKTTTSNYIILTPTPFHQEIKNNVKIYKRNIILTIIILYPNIYTDFWYITEITRNMDFGNFILKLISKLEASMVF